MRTMADVLKKIALHTAAVYLAMFAGAILEVLLVLVSGTDRLSPIGRLLEAPYWLPQVACGLALGWLVKRRFAVNLFGLGIIVPAALLLISILFEGLPMRRYTPLVDIYFSANSGDSEGLYEVIFTAPLYAAVAYALGALAAKRIKKEPREAKPAPGASPA